MDKAELMKLEKRIGSNAGAALAGIKPASLLCLKYADNPEIKIGLEIINEKLKNSGIIFYVLNDNGYRLLLLVFREKNMKLHLEKIENSDFLQKYGYPEGNLYKKLNYLSSIIKVQGCFPHEAGIFLGYPIEDIVGFVRNPKGYKVCGCWKVYNNADEKIKLFKRYKKCSECINRRINNGDGLEKIFA